jgi:peptide/nickel transport system ATP-binding protein
MYLGQVVEKAQPDALFARPLHPYTKALLSAIPIADPDIKQRKEILKGEISSPVNMGPGCRFAKRCPAFRPECAEKPVAEREIEPGHSVTCNLQ